MIYITRKETFNAAHKLYRPEWSDERNLEVFGGCSNPNWHGHNYELHITIKGEVDPLTGFLMDLKLLKQIIKDKVVDQIDHKNLNLDVPFMNGKMASTEVLAIEIWKQLQPSIQGASLHCVKIYETSNNYAEYYG